MFCNIMEDNGKPDSNIPTSESNKKNSTNREISKRESIFLLISDILVLATILLDVSHLGDIIKVDELFLFVLNILTVTISYLNYRMKKKISRRMFESNQKK